MKGYATTVGAPARTFSFVILLAFICLGSIAPGANAGIFDLFSEDVPLIVEIADPYIEMHTGDGQGYPIFHVEEQGSTVEILKRRTDWFKVRTSNGKEGWVAREQLERTLTPTGEQMDIRDATLEEFAFRRWEMGAMGGEFEDADVMTVYGSFFLTPKLSVEASASKIFPDNSDGDMVDANILIHPFPTWRISPFFGVGTGLVHSDPDSTLVQESDRTDQVANVGTGVRVYLARRFIFRAQYKHYVIFESSDNNQEIDEWKAGFAVFF